MKRPDSASIDVDALNHRIRGLAVASFGIGLFSLFTFWWFPFGLCMGVLAAGLGSTSIALGVRTVDKGLFFAAGGIALANAAIGHALLAGKLTFLFFTTN